MTFQAHAFPASRLFNAMLATQNAAHTAPDVSIDVTETDAAYTLKANIPGAAKEDVAISIDRNIVKLDVEFKHDASEGADTAVWRERQSGKASRLLKFAQMLDADGAIAKQENGVLTLTLPKKQDTQTKRVTIQ